MIYSTHESQTSDSCISTPVRRKNILVAAIRQLSAGSTTGETSACNFQLGEIHSLTLGLQIQVSLLERVNHDKPNINQIDNEMSNQVACANT